MLSCFLRPWAFRTIVCQFIVSIVQVPKPLAKWSCYLLINTAIYFHLCTFWRPMFGIEFLGMRETGIVLQCLLWWKVILSFRNCQKPFDLWQSRPGSYILHICHYNNFFSDRPNLFRQSALFILLFRSGTTCVWCDIRFHYASIQTWWNSLCR